MGPHLVAKRQCQVDVLDTEERPLLKPWCKVEIRMAVCIMTGALVPEGADCVVKFEDTGEMERRQYAVRVVLRDEYCQ